MLTQRKVKSQGCNNGEGDKSAGDEMKKVVPVLAKQQQRALTFRNIDRNLLAEKCCAIATKASRAEKNRLGLEKEKKKAMDTLSDFASDRSCFQ